LIASVLYSNYQKKDIKSDLSDLKPIMPSLDEINDLKKELEVEEKPKV
jgi:hypothetical protein